MRRISSVTYVLIAGLAGGGCEESKCETILKPSFEVTAVDSVTSAAVIDGLSGSLVDGSFRAEMMSHGNRLFYTETYRPGRYDITVRANGYREWRATNVRLRMEADGCHIELVKLVAKLQR